MTALPEKTGANVSRIKAFGGVTSLKGTKLVRLVYIDEAGISKDERHSIVAGPIIHGDHQLAVVEDHLLGLVEKHIPSEEQFGFIFHAKEIWSGTGYFKNRDKWPLAKRLEILRDLAAIPTKLAIPVTYGVGRKELIATHLKEENVSVKTQEFVEHVSALANAMQLVELFMREKHPDEFTLIIAEDRDHLRSMLKDVHATFRGRHSLSQTGQFLKIRSVFKFLPFHHIRDTIHFAKKEDCQHLQLADICAFLIRGHFRDHPHNPPLFEILRPALLVPPSYYRDHGEQPC